MLIVLTSIIYFERVYLREWLNHHLNQGVDLISVVIIYGQLHLGSVIDRDDDVYQAIRDEYHEKDRVIFYHIESDRKMRFPLIDNLFERYPGPGQWCLPIDIDEFLFINKPPIQQQLNFYQQHKINNVLINWICYGSGGIEQNPDYRVMDIFMTPTHPKAPCNFETKCLFRLKPNTKFDYVNPHRFVLNEKHYTSNGVEIVKQNRDHLDDFTAGKIERVANRIGSPSQMDYLDSNLVYPEDDPSLIIRHYITRSRDEYQKKIELNKNNPIRYNWHFFEYINNSRQPASCLHATQVQITERNVQMTQDMPNAKMPNAKMPNAKMPNAKMPNNNAKSNCIFHRNPFINRLKENKNKYHTGSTTLNTKFRRQMTSHLKNNQNSQSYIWFGKDWTINDGELSDIKHLAQSFLSKINKI